MNFLIYFVYIASNLAEVLMQVNGMRILNSSVCQDQSKELDSKLEICAGKPIELDSNDKDKKIKDSCRVG